MKKVLGLLLAVSVGFQTPINAMKKSLSSENLAQEIKKLNLSKDNADNNLEKIKTLVTKLENKEIREAYKISHDDFERAKDLVKKLSPKEDSRGLLHKETVGNIFEELLPLVIGMNSSILQNMQKDKENISLDANRLKLKVTMMALFACLTLIAIGNQQGYWSIDLASGLAKLYEALNKMNNANN